MTIKEFVLEYFEKKTNLDKNYLRCDVNYFKEEYIDSFGVFELINALEDEYNFEFDNDDFQHRDFVTIDGISKMIEKKIIAL
jgi:acyl carrier protein